MAAFTKFVHIHETQDSHCLINTLAATQETQVQSLDQEDPPEKKKAALSSTLAWKIPWTEEPGGLVCGVTVGQTEQLTLILKKYVYICPKKYI